MNEDRSKKADELREKLRHARSAPTEDTSTTFTASADSESGLGQDEIRVNTPSSVVQRYSPIGGSEDRGTERAQDATTGRGNQSPQSNIRSLLGQNDRDKPIGGAASKSQRGVLGSLGSATQDNQRVRPQPGRSGENNPTYRTNGINVSSGITTSQRPKRVGNLVRNELEEPTFTPRRFFNGTENSEKPENNVVSEREQTRPNTDTSPKTPTEKRPVEGITPPRKRGRPRIKVDVPEPPDTQETDAQPQGIRERVSEFLPRYNGNKLTAQEAKNIQEPLAAALEDIFEEADKFLMKYCGLPPIEHGSQPVWSDISEKEMKSFVTSWTALGQKSAIAAGVARGAVGLSDFIVGAAVLGPRIKRSGELIRASHEYRRSQRVERTTRRANIFSRRRLPGE